MKYTVSTINPNKAPVDVLGVFVSSEDKFLKKSCSFLPSELYKEIKKLAHAQLFTGKQNHVMTVNAIGKFGSMTIVCVGIGNIKEPSEIIAERVREAAGNIIQIAGKYSAAKIGLVVPEITKDKLDAKDVGKALAEGIELGSYCFIKYKTAKEDAKPFPVKSVVFFTDDKQLLTGVKQGECIAHGVTLARDLVNEPPEQMRPEHLLDIAKHIAQNAPYSVSLTYLNKERLTKGGFGGILGVSQGSHIEPYLIHLIYKPSKKYTRKIAFVGKGITFDSGGISLKPANYMENMKTDMAGGAAVLGLFSIIHLLQPQAEVHGIVAACENMPSSTAIKPGDIITIKNGKTVEVLNTDAEGRIILADALSYAVEEKMDAIIDLATLTGACIAALGNDVAAILGNNQKFVDEILAASRKSGEKLWQLPLEERYRESLKSPIADIQNISPIKGAGTITGAQFLEYFVCKTIWAHLDIAGTAWAEKPLNAYTPLGGTGYGVRTLAEYLNTFVS